MFLLAPARWPVDLVALLPDFLRPGVLVGLVLLTLWFVVIQRGVPDLWHAACRATARVVDVIIGIALLPDYLLTTSRQRRGRQPGRAVMAIGGVAESLLDGTGSFYQRHQREPIRWKRFPWKTLTIAVVVFTVPWVVMKLTSPRSIVRQELAEAFNVWRDVETWAHVDASRRAAPGVVWPPRPRVVRIRHRGRAVAIAIHCPYANGCKGRLILRNGRGQRLHTREVRVGASGGATIQMRLPRNDAQANHVFVRVARVGPE